MSLNNRHHVLCVDGSADCLEMLSELLKTSEIDATSATTASQALSMARTEPFDLYILEAWLPNTDGFELCRQLRTSDPDTPIVFYSAAAYEADQRRAIQAGATAYVSKPHINALLQSISQYIPNTAAAGA